MIRVLRITLFVSSPPFMAKYYSRLGSLALVWKSVKEKEISVFKPAELHLKINLVSHLTRDGRVG